MARFALLITPLSLLGLAGAQTVADLLNQLPSCATECAVQRFNTSDCATWDVVCGCQSSNFLPANSPCLIDACTASDIQSTESIWSQICARVSVTTGATAATSTAEGPSTDLEALRTTTDVYNHTFTVTGLLLGSGSNTTFVPYHTVSTFTTNGSIITEIMNITSTLSSSSSQTQYNSTSMLNTTQTTTSTPQPTSATPTTSASVATTSSTSLANRVQQHWAVAIMSLGVMWLRF